MLRRFISPQRISSFRYIAQSTIYRNNKKNNDDSDEHITASIATRFQVFKDQNVGKILDIEEERSKMLEIEEKGLDVGELQEQDEEKASSIYANLNLERGKTGVFEIEDLVHLLREENAIDICVIRLPKELSYVDYMCIVTGSSHRHRLGIAHFVRKVFKMKRHPNDHIPKIEGEECKSWIAMDLGNIALHIFSRDARDNYNLESLWLLGEEYEKKISKRELFKDELFEHYFPTPVENSETLNESVHK